MAANKSLYAQTYMEVFLTNGTLSIIQGFKREWVPFVLTPDFVYVMGGEVSVCKLHCYKAVPFMYHLIL